MSELSGRSYRGRIVIEVDFDAPFTNAEIELTRLAGVAISQIATEPDVDDVRGLNHELNSPPSDCACGHPASAHTSMGCFAKACSCREYKATDE